MKCLACGQQNDYRTRTAKGRACARCGRRFVFEPREGDPLTDRSFHSAIEAVSDGSRLAWLERNLYFEVARRVRRKRLLHRLFRESVSIDARGFSALLRRWTAEYGSPPGRLAAGSFERERRATPRAADTFDYGFDRLLVCGSDAIVDLLLANGFHSDHRCAVLGADGYPGWASELLLPRLRASPPQTVVVLHDAGPAGFQLAARVAGDHAWFGGIEGVRIVDGGLSPQHVPRFRGLLVGDVVELAAVRPRVLLAQAAAIVAGLEEAADANDGDPGGFVPVWRDDGGGDGDDDVG